MYNAEGRKTKPQTFVLYTSLKWVVPYMYKYKVGYTGSGLFRGRSVYIGALLEEYYMSVWYMHTWVS